MKLFKNNRLLILSLLIVVLLSSCSKSIVDTSYSGYDGKVYMSQAVSGRNVFSLPLSSKPFALGYGASYGGTTHAAENDIPIKFALKNDWINNYNIANSTSYVSLPTEAYNIPSFTSVIRKGHTTTDSLFIKIESKKLDRAKKYMFPITMLSAGSDKIDSAMQTVWFRIDTIVRAERDVTSKGVISVSNDNSGGPDANEGSKKLVDNSIDTKFLVFNIGTILPNFWYQLSFADPITLGAYTLTSANDAPERDPKDWKLLGSNDGINWTTLDTRTNQMFAGRKQTTRFEFDNNVPYTIYRVAISAINGATLFQQAEWRVIEFFEQ